MDAWDFGHCIDLQLTAEPLLASHALNWVSVCTPYDHDVAMPPRHETLELKIVHLGAPKAFGLQSVSVTAGCDGESALHGYVQLRFRSVHPARPAEILHLLG